MSEDTAHRRYEIMLLCTSELGEKEVQSAIDGVKKLITDAGGTVDFEDFWGKRKLAYPIQNEDFGYYHVMLFDADPEFIQGFEKDLQLNKDVLRSLISIPPKDYQPITSGEVEAAEDAYWSEHRAKKMGKPKRQQKPQSSASRTPVKKEIPVEEEKETEDTKEERQKKLDKILSDDLNV